MGTNNNKAMREALNDVLEKIDRWRTDGVMEHWQYSQLFDIADAALAAAPRNCDIGTAEEQAKRFTKYCHAKRHSVSECLSCPLFMQTGGHCELAWVQMPYEEKKNRVAQGIASLDDLKW